jgi:16S rRNA (cytosine967-C5)-methyltransferase
VFEAGAYADRALESEAAGLDARDRALTTRLVFGTVQRQATLDHLIDALSSRPADRLDPAVLAALRLGLYGLLFLERTPAHAVVSDSVSLVKDQNRGGAGLVNAVLRRAAREGDALLSALEDRTPAEAAIRHSVPRWLAELWWAELGPEAARSLLETVNEPAEAALRVNTLRAEPGVVRDVLPVAARPIPDLPGGLVLEAPFDVHGSALHAEGAIMPQSRASMLVGRIVDPQPGERILDLCAAPGGKTTHLAALSGDQASILAVEHHPGRAAALERTCRRMGASSVAVRVADAADPGLEDRFDRILVDPPCSGLGTLRSRPDLRWRTSRDRMRELAALGARLLDAAAPLVAPGGRLVFSVCTISRAEGPDQIAGFLARHPEFAADDLVAAHPGVGDPAAAPHLQLRPDLDGTDGFFIARLRRGDRRAAG